MKKALLPLGITLVAASAQAGIVITDGADIRVSTQGGLTVATTDGKSSISLGGQFQWDYDATNSEDYNRDTQDVDVRRARLSVSGHHGDWVYRAQFNISESSGGNAGRSEALYIRYIGFGKLANITVGKQKEPFSLDALHSANDLSMLERSALTEFFVPPRSAGVQVQGEGSNWTYGIGVFEGDGDGPSDFEDRAWTGRVTFAPIQSSDKVMHLGAGYTHRDVRSSRSPSIPDFEAFDGYNLELGLVSGPFHAQAEYFDARVETPTSEMTLDGYYLQLGWVITGESLPYRGGKFNRVRPASASGAWEVVARYEDGFGDYSDTGLALTEGKQMALGLNYFVNNNVRLGLSYMSAEEDNSGFEGEELRARLQFVF